MTSVRTQLLTAYAGYMFVLIDRVLRKGRQEFLLMHVKLLRVQFGRRDSQLMYGDWPLQHSHSGPTAVNEKRAMVPATGDNHFDRKSSRQAAVASRVLLLDVLRLGCGQESRAYLMGSYHKFQYHTGD